MALKITEDCINCGVCEPECPSQAISDGEDIYHIDSNLCYECVDAPGVLCSDVCPVDCIIADTDCIESIEELKKKRDRLFTKP